MKIRNISILSIIVFLLIFTFFLVKTIDRANRGLLKNTSVKKVKVEGLQFSIPAGFKQIKTSTSYNWETRLFKSGRLFFRISTASKQKKSVEKVVKTDLKIDKLPDTYKFYLSKLAFLTRIKGIEKGFYFIKHKNKTNHYVFIFQHKETVFYVDFFVPATFSKYKEVFDKIILSIQTENGLLFNNLSEAENTLKGICKKTYFILCQPEKFFIVALPSIIGILMILSLFFATRGMGKLPEDIISLGIMPVFSEEDVDTIFKFPGKSQWLTTALVIDNEGIRVFYRKKEILFISQKRARDFLKEGKNMWGRYIEIQIDKKELKKPPINIKFMPVNKIKLRLYPKNIDRILAFIKT